MIKTINIKSKGFTRKNFSKKNLGGFTLIELLVVIAIIGILAGVVLTSLNSARSKGRDARRLSDIHQINNALALYYDDHEYYPDGSGSMTPSRSNNTTEWDEFRTWLAANMGTVPVDPLNTPPYVYTYTPGDVFNSTYSLTYELENKPEIVRVNAAASAPVGGSTSVTLDLIVGNVVVVAQTQWVTLSGVVTDNLGNTYTMVPGSQNAADNIVHSWWITVVQFGGTATISTNHGSYPSIEAIQYSGIDTTDPVDVAVCNAAFGGLSPVFSTDTADEVILTVGHTQYASIVYTLLPTASTMVFEQSDIETYNRPVVELIVDSLQTNIQTSIAVSGGNIYRTSTISLRRK